jgi:hypothetical protein
MSQPTRHKVTRRISILTAENRWDSGEYTIEKDQPAAADPGKFQEELENIVLNRVAALASQMWIPASKPANHQSGKPAPPPMAGNSIPQQPTNLLPYNIQSLDWKQSQFPPAEEYTVAEREEAQDLFKALDAANATAQKPVEIQRILYWLNPARNYICRRPK